MWNTFTDAFYLNFVSENRWKYLTDGLKTTLIITLFACLMGIVLGFIVGMIRSTYEKTRKLKLLNAICKVYLTVIRGTPVIVQLLIIYFVLFGSVRIDKVLVAILAFGINSGAYVAEIFRSGIMSIDGGQMEAGRSLGFNYAQTMWYIIMPQAFKTVLPTLCNEFISLLKETSVAGYIAIQDLTKGGDIIRSRTYSAFMPLIAVALIYLIIVMIFTKLIQILERRLRQNER
nr:amino acid ABC transporter permease [uncultured Lachnoclostridium sp.]